jgi:DNA modification methylase
MDIKRMNVLNTESCRADKDEKHMCPLQLDVIERALFLWSNPGDLVFSPFAGVGSEGVVALKMGRRFLGVELKPEYFRRATRNLSVAGAQLELAI